MVRVGGNERSAATRAEEGKHAREQAHAGLQWGEAKVKKEPVIDSAHLWSMEGKGKGGEKEVVRGRPS